MSLAFIFSDVGAGEWFVLLAVVLVVMGPRRLPGAARKFGAYYSKFRRAADAFRRQLLEMDTEIDNAISSAERDAASAFTVDDGPGGGGSSDDPDYGYGHDYSDYDGVPGAGGDAGDAAGSAAAADSAAAAPAEPQARKPRDMSAIKVTVSPAPKGGGSAGPEV